MTSKILSKKPLVEAIFELRWELQEIQSDINIVGPNIGIDPNYQIMIGRYYDRVSSEYPYYEKLSTAKMPEEISGYVVQQRFRASKDKWPLVQLGPGIITLNDTDNYVWDDFYDRITLLIDTLYESYPNSSEELNFNKIQLRYIDAVEFDFEKKNIFDFFKEMMKISVSLPNSLFRGNRVNQLPLGTDLRFSFPVIKPKGALHLRFTQGTRREKNAILWETTIVSLKGDVPKTKKDILQWATEAHDLTHDWFFKIIEGELERRFE